MGISRMPKNVRLVFHVIFSEKEFDTAAALIGPIKRLCLELGTM